MRAHLPMIGIPLSFVNISSWIFNWHRCRTSWWKTTDFRKSEYRVVADVLLNCDSYQPLKLWMCQLLCITAFKRQNLFKLRHYRLICNSRLNLARPRRFLFPSQPEPIVIWGGIVIHNDKMKQISAVFSDLACWRKLTDTLVIDEPVTFCRYLPAPSRVQGRGRDASKRRVDWTLLGSSSGFI